MLDIGAPEFLVLIVAAVVLFGPEKLPDLARKAARVIKYVRQIASNAQNQLSEELGPEFSDLDFRDLNPKAFVQKHLLSGVEPIIAEVKDDFAEGTNSIQTMADDFNAALSGNGPTGVADRADRTSDVLDGQPRTPFDPDAT